jgi:hypothetical protein
MLMMKSARQWVEEGGDDGNRGIKIRVFERLGNIIDETNYYNATESGCLVSPMSGCRTYGS